MKFSGKRTLIFGAIVGTVVVLVMVRRLRLGKHEAATPTVSSSDVRDLVQSAPLPATPTTAMAAALQEVVQEMHAPQAERNTTTDIGGPVVGNLRTLIYHPVDSHNLPTEDNRMYFASEEEAVAAGYHRAGNE